MENWQREVRGYIRSKRAMECYRTISDTFLIDQAAMKFGLTDRQRLLLHREGV